MPGEPIEEKFEEVKKLEGDADTKDRIVLLRSSRRDC